MTGRLAIKPLAMIDCVIVLCFTPYRQYFQAINGMSDYHNALYIKSYKQSLLVLGEAPC